MKYLKVTVTVFLVALVLSATSTFAQTRMSFNINIPIFSGKYTSSQGDKTDIYAQKAIKNNSSDNLTGDARAIEGRIYGMFADLGYTEWKELPKGSLITWSGTHTAPGAYKFQMRSIKSLPTTAYVNAFWYMDY